MRFPQLGAGIITLGSLGHAFLLPPTISQADTDIVNALLPIQHAVPVAEDRVLDVPCAGCAVNIVDIQGHVTAVSSRIENVLRFNMTISRSSGGGPDSFLLNGVQLYPVAPTIDVTSKFTADQLVKKSDGKWQYAASPELGYMFSVGHPQTEDGDLGLVELHLEVLDVGGKPVNIPTLEVKLVETPSGKLMTGQAVLEAPRAQKTGCTTAFCRWKAMIAEKLSFVKGKCGGKPKHSEPRPNIQVGATIGMAHKPNHLPGAGHHGGRPRPHGHGHGRHGHRRHGGFSRFVRGIVFHVLVPVLIGAGLGIAASIVGMIAGHFVLFLWRTFFRRGQSQQEVEAEDTKGLINNQSPPPSYEEAPAYEDAVLGEKQ